jgi:hypothetical protein
MNYTRHFESNDGSSKYNINYNAQPSEEHKEIETELLGQNVNRNPFYF